MADEALAAFMDATGCSYDDAFHRLASCGGHLGEAVNRFFNVDAGTSGSRRSPPPPPPLVISSDSESEDGNGGAARAPVPAAARPADRPAGARGRSPPAASAPRRVSRWDSEATKGGGGSSSKSGRRRRRRREMEASRKHDRVEKKKRRRVGEDDGPSRGGKSSGRRRRFRDVFVSCSDGEEEEEEVVKANKSRRRRLNPKDDSSDSDEVQVIGSSSGGGRPNRGGKAPTSGAAAVVKKEGCNSSISGRPNSGGKAPTPGAAAVVKKEGGKSSISDRPNRGGKAPAAAAVVKKEGGNSSSLRRRILGNTYSSYDDLKLKVYDAPPPPRASNKSDKDKLFRVPHGLTYKGGFHDAVAHAARRCRWLLVNVQGLDLASLAQNRDVWASDLVAQCVREHFVLWQADAGDDEHEERGAGAEGEEAAKVLSYYKIPRDKVPIVIIVDPVTGQAVRRLHGTDPNDFLVSMGPYTEKRPAFPVVGSAKKSTAAPTSRQEQTTPTTVRKPAEQPVATAVAMAPMDQQPAAICKLRVRLADGRMVAKDFGSQCAVADLFAYCRSEMGAGAAAARPFRLLRFVGAARVEIVNDNASFESLGLHMSTVCVELR